MKSKNKEKTFLIILFSLVAAIFLCFKKDVENNKYDGFKRIRYKFGLPFGKKKTYLLVDVNGFDGSKIYFIFDYKKNLVYSINSMGLEDVW